MGLSCLWWSQGKGWMLCGASRRLPDGEEERPSMLQVGRHWGMLPGSLLRYLAPLRAG